MNQKQRINESKNRVFEKINKDDKSLTQLTNRKKEKEIPN